MNEYKHRPLRLPGFDYRAARTYFTTFNTWKRVPVFADPMLGALACRVIMRYRDEGLYYLYAYVVMPDHVHLLIKLRERALFTIIATIKATIKHDARQLIKLEWQPGFHDRIKRDYEESGRFVHYIINNPVRAGLCKEPSEYPFSGMPDCWKW